MHPCSHIYTELEEEINKKGLYDPINLREFAPEGKKARYHYYQRLRLPFDVDIFEKSMGNNQHKHMLIWKVPETSGEVHDLESIKICNKINNELPEYHTRAMISKATRHWTKVKKLSNQTLIQLYKSFTGDASKIPDSEATDILLGKINSGDNVKDISDVMNSSYKD